jgi:hypothetical protein
MANMVRADGPVSNTTALSAFHASIDPGSEGDAKLGSSGAGTRKEWCGRPDLNRHDLAVDRF